MLSLGIDVGSTNLKALLYELGGHPRMGGDSGVRHVLAAASTPTPGSGAELVDGVLGLVRQVVARAGRAPDCVGVASMAETGVPLDAQDCPLGDLVRWDGRRGSQDADRLAEALGADALFAATGVRPSAKAPLAVWAHLRRTAPDRWAALHRWAGAGDLVVLALTGRLATDHTLAGRTAAYRLPALGHGLEPRFDTDLLVAVGLRPEQLPDVVLPGELAGRVQPPGAAGLRPGTPVVVAGHDHAVGAWAVGVRQPGQVADSVGTAEAVIRVVDARPDPRCVRTAGMSLVRTVAGTHDALVAGSPSAGAMLPWWSERFAPGRDAGALLSELNRDRDPTGLFVLPYLSGRQSPHPAPAATARLVGEPAGRSLRDLAGALLDGLSLHARWMIIEQARLAGHDPGVGAVVALGSPVRSDSPWLWTKAAVGPAPVRAVLVPEPVAEGAALLAAVRAGLLEAPESVLGTRRVEQSRHAAYDVLFAEFVAAALDQHPGF